MKNLTKIVLVLSVLFAQNFAHANCPGNSFEGVFKNPRGDRFKIEQSDCDHLQVTDLQTQDVFVASTDAFALQAKPTSNGFIGFTMNHLPISIRLGKRVTQQYYTEQEIDFRATLPVDSMHGLSSPTLSAKAFMYAAYGEISINTSKGPVSAEHQASESSVQWGFIEGISFGLNLLTNELGLNLYDTLKHE